MIVSTLRSLGLLAFIWSAIGLVAFAAGELPGAEAVSGPVEPEPEPAAVDADEAADAEPPSEPSPEISEPAPAAVIIAEAPSLAASYRVCVGESSAFAPLDLVGDARTEVAVGCGSNLLLIGFREDGVPVRVGTLRAADSERWLAAMAVDLNGDGHRDLVASVREVDGARGRLVVAYGSGRGGFGAPEVLAPIVATIVLAGDFDGEAGEDLAALHHADAFGRRPSELWVFAGGPSPERRVRQAFRGAPLGLRWTGAQFTVLSDRGALHFEGGAEGLSAVPAPTGAGQPESDPPDGESESGEGVEAQAARAEPPRHRHIVTHDDQLFVLGDTVQRIEAPGTVDAALGPRGAALLRGGRIEFGPLRTPFAANAQVALPEGALGRALRFDGDALLVLFARGDSVELVRLNADAPVQIEAESTALAVAPLTLELTLR
ncbi:MAG: VCBS repeat-containing protein [Myxococcota bacterium]